MSDIARLEVQWDEDEHQVVRYVVYSVDSDGQYAVEGTFEQGPFDTALEVAQWVWRTVGRRLPPSRC